jgi:hypothetical protein
MTHDLKIAPVYFREVKSGKKPFELRKNDRGYAIGDTLRLREWAPPSVAPGPNGDGHTGRVVTARVSYVLAGGGLGLSPDYCVLGLRDIFNCEEAGQTADGECVGYQRSEYDDEPCERCMECPRNQFYEGENK